MAQEVEITIHVENNNTNKESDEVSGIHTITIERIFEAVRNNPLQGELPRELAGFLISDTERFLHEKIKAGIAHLSAMQLEDKQKEFKLRVYQAWINLYEDIVEYLRKDPLNMEGYTQGTIASQRLKLLNEIKETSILAFGDLLDVRKIAGLSDNENIKPRQNYELTFKDHINQCVTELEAWLAGLDRDNERGFSRVLELLELQRVKTSEELLKNSEKRGQYAEKHILLCHEHEEYLKRRYSICESLLEDMGADENLKNLPSIMKDHPLPIGLKHPIEETGNTLLHEAVIFGNVLLVKFLMEYGADPFHKNAAGESAIYLAGVRENPKILHVVIKYLADKPVKPDTKIQGEFEKICFNSKKPFYAFPSLEDTEIKQAAIVKAWELCLRVKKRLDNAAHIFLKNYDGFIHKLFDSQHILARLKEISQLYEKLHNHYSEMKIEDFRIYYKSMFYPGVYDRQGSVFHENMEKLLDALEYNPEIFRDYSIKKEVNQVEIGGHNYNEWQEIEKTLATVSQSLKIKIRECDDKGKEVILLKTENLSLKEDKEKLQRELNEVKKENKAREDEIAVLKNDKEILINKIGNYEKEIEHLKEGQTALRIECDKKIDGIKKELISFFREEFQKTNNVKVGQQSFSNESPPINSIQPPNDPKSLDEGNNNLMFSYSPNPNKKN